jgi:GNAT superfamily N-acetyltransferase
VAKPFRRKGIGARMVELCLSKLGAIGVQKCNIFLYADNEPGERFWKENGWIERTELKVLTKETSDESGRTVTVSDAGQEMQIGLKRISNAVDSAATKEEVAILDGQLESFNAQETGRNDFRPLHLVVRGDDGSLIAGLKTVTGWDWLHVQVLWVHENHRRKGLGSFLLQNAEGEARRRGCLGACLSSYSFQAPEFYERHGYAVFGQIDDYPPGHTMYFLSKRLQVAKP